MKKIVCRITKKHIWKEISGAYVNNYGLTGRLITFKCKRCKEDKKEFYGTLTASFGDLLDAGMAFDKGTELVITNCDGVKID